MLRQVIRSHLIGIGRCGSSILQKLRREGLLGNWKDSKLGGTSGGSIRASGTSPSYSTPFPSSTTEAVFFCRLWLGELQLPSSPPLPGGSLEDNRVKMRPRSLRRPGRQKLLSR